MENENKFLTTIPTALTKFDPQARKLLVSRGLIALSKDKDADYYFFKGEEHRIHAESQGHEILKKNIKQAIFYYKRSLEVDPKHKQSLFWMGYCYFHFRHWEDWTYLFDKYKADPYRWLATSAFQRLVTILEESDTGRYWAYVGYHYLGHAQYDSRLYEDAIRSYNRALELWLPGIDHDHLAALYPMPEYSFFKLTSDAFHEESIEIDPYVGAYDKLGCAQYGLGLYEDAIESFGHALECIQYPTAYFYLGVAQYNLGLGEEAIISLEQVFEHRPQDWLNYRAYLLLGLAQYSLGLYEDAIESFGHAVECIKFPDAYLYLRAAQYNLELIMSLEKVLELDPGSANLYFLLAVCQDSPSNYQSALGNFQIFLQLVNRDAANGEFKARFVGQDVISYATRRVDEIQNADSL